MKFLVLLKMVKVGMPADLLQAMTETKLQNGSQLKSKDYKNVLFEIRQSVFYFANNIDNFVRFCNSLKRNCNIFTAFFSNIDVIIGLCEIMQYFLLSSFHFANK